MPKRKDLKKILIIGAGPIVIGQACEFDYSGVQACKALKEEGFKVILVNSNPATIMTDPEMADSVYIEPLNKFILEKILEREKPDAILPTMGGQTALNLALALSDDGILERLKIELIGANRDAIDKAEDRRKFKVAMEKIGLKTAKSGVAHTISEANAVRKEISAGISGAGFPLIVRPSFTLGGSGGGIAYNSEEFDIICARGLDASPIDELLIEESLIGWKEFEMEVVRDKMDNCVIICSIENIDPMGIHTGDSITVAPAQTLTDKEYQQMRVASIDILREIGVDTGGSNVQFAVNPSNGKMVVVEMNPRVSRSSALASKATGFPIAKVAAKLAIGYTLDELSNEITGGRIPSSFEPTIDYVVTKMPRFAFEKFPLADDKLTTQMKSVGEVMAIGRTFQESLQKALRGLEVGSDGFNRLLSNKESIEKRLVEPSSSRIWVIGDAFAQGFSLEEVKAVTQIDKWFLGQIKELIEIELALERLVISDIDKYLMLELKQKGFSDKRLSSLLDISEQQLRKLRHSQGVRPVYKRVDSCAGEFDATTSYFYSTYEEENESVPSKEKKVVILGGGPNRIGQGIEFDYCCVHAALALRSEGYETIMINCNPETVSTDFDISDRLYFEPLTFEDVFEILELEKPLGVIVQFGGQTPLKLCRDLELAGITILGTKPEAIDLAEDRERFQKLLTKLGLRQPSNKIARNEGEAIYFGKEIGFPLLVRPSYVLGGRAMEIVQDEDDLKKYFLEAVKVSDESPVLLDRFLNDATEVDVDCIFDGREAFIGGISEHIEQAGVHSGDSACSLPPFSLSETITGEIRRETVALAKALEVKGLMNIQFAIQNDKVFVLEVNPRASRTIPFVSKATGIPLAKIASKVMLDITLKEQGIGREILPNYFSVKEAVFPFSKFIGVDTILGPEMKSTGEVMGIGSSFAEAFIKSQLGAGINLPRPVEGQQAFLSVKDNDKRQAVKLAEKLVHLGFELIGTKGTASVIAKSGIKIQVVNKVAEGRPHIVDLIKSGSISFILNTVEERKNAIIDSKSIRTSALTENVTTYTTISGAKAAIDGMLSIAESKLEVYNLRELIKL
ncbi:MAG: carbamoyl phosphate synthase large subunit [Betaproteobacteria bacterium TMED82]|nr:MAG: carbamoyl phosphate synthase large subunit [Betaproteobacteria bacterium TMED82]|tara:strand:+ start:122659 stop:125895 length:3237 start_codon:yes stop_codon:yes gene_type:complete